MKIQITMTDKGQKEAMIPAYEEHHGKHLGEIILAFLNNFPSGKVEVERIPEEN